MSRTSIGGEGEPKGERRSRSQLQEATGERSHAGDVPSDDSALIERLIAAAPHAMAITDSSSHVLRQVNASFCRFMGVAEEEVVDRAYTDAMRGRAADAPLALLERVFSSGLAEQDQEVTLEGIADEPEVWSYTVWPLRNRSGAIGGLVVEVRDRRHEAESTRRLREMADEIRKINERLLRSAIREHEWLEKAEAAARAKSDFLAMMSHELRTPLSGIVGFTEVLLGDIHGPTNERQRESLDRIHTCSGQLLELIDDVLSYTQVEADSVRPRPERIDLCQLAREVAEFIEPLAARKRLDLSVQIADSPIRLETDAPKVRQILLNLLGNAVKFTERGEVRLEVREACEEHPESVRLLVRDTGIGIPPQDLDRVFEPFVQGEEVLTRQFGGTGLGLTISRALAVLLGGTLTGESIPGRGSTFTVQLPCRPAASQTPHGVRDETSSPGRVP